MLSRPDLLLLGTKVTALRKQLANRAVEVASLQERVQALTGEAMSLQAHSAERSRELGSLQAQVVTLQATVAAREVELRCSEIARLQAQDTERTREVDNLQTQITVLQTTAAAREEELRSVEIGRLQAQGVERSRELGNLQVQVAALQAATTARDAELHCLLEATQKALHTGVASLLWRTLRRLGALPRRSLRLAKQLRGRLQFFHPLVQQQAKALLATGLFDVDFYLRSYPDVAAAGLDPAAHYLLVGAREGRDPHPLFRQQLLSQVQPRSRRCRP